MIDLDHFFEREQPEARILADRIRPDWVEDAPSRVTFSAERCGRDSPEIEAHESRSEARS